MSGRYKATPDKIIEIGEKLYNSMSDCQLCPMKCRVNRLEGELGECHSGDKASVASFNLHFGEEPPISGTRGSGTIFFAGCNLHCVFCQNYQISQEFRPTDQQRFSVAELADEMLRLQGMGAHNINFVSPTHMIYQMADAVVKARQNGLAIPIVYNSNGYDSVDALRRIRGLVDIYLPDVKYIHNNLAKRFSDVKDYADVVPGVIAEMLHQVGHLQLDDDGIAVRGLLVRHLVLPGHVANSRDCLAFLADLAPEVHLSIMSQYSPQYKACDVPPLDRKLSSVEYENILNYADVCGLQNAFIQELASQDNYVPDFYKSAPFATGSREK